MNKEKGELILKQRGIITQADKLGGVVMGSLSNLVYYASVAKGTTILAQHTEGASDLADVAIECLGKVPPLHRRFTYTTKRRMFSCLMEDSLTYCAIVDEALGKVTAYAFLERIRDEFKVLLHAQGLRVDGDGLEPYCLADEFACVFSHLIAPLVGVPQKEVDRMEEELRTQRNGEYDDDEASIETHPPEVTTSEHKQTDRERIPEKNSDRRFRFSPLSPLRGKGGKANKKKVKDQVTEVKEIMMENSGKALDKGQKLEVMVEGGSTPDAIHHVQKSGNLRHKGQQLAHRMWWRNVKLVLILDIVVCAILFAIWLGICKGFRCVRK